MCMLWKRNFVLKATILVGSLTLCLIFIGSDRGFFAFLQFHRQDPQFSSASRSKYGTQNLKKSVESIDAEHAKYINIVHAMKIHKESSKKILRPIFESPQIKNWTILLTVNNGYFDFFWNWFWAYRQLDIKYSIIIIAEDEIVYKKLKLFQSETVKIEKSEYEPVENSAAYGSKNFSKLVSQRPTHILRYLTKGVNVLYTDIDMVWLKSPFPYFTGDFDMWIELDSVNNYCTGLMAIKSNENCIRLIKSWQKSLQLKLEIDQTAFNKVVNNAPINLSVLDSRLFPTGFQYFVNYTEEQRTLAVVVHNNWIVGKESKFERFKKFKLWFLPVLNSTSELHAI